MKKLVTKMTSADRQDLARAKALLENPGIAAQIANVVGVPIELLLSKKTIKKVGQSNQ